MGDLAGGVVAGVLVVLLGEHLRVLQVLGVEEKAVADDLAALDAEVAEGHHGGGGRRGRPLLDVDLCGRAWDGLRQQALGDDVEDAGVGEIGEESCVEGVLQAVGLRIGGGGFEVGDGDADVGDAAGGLGLERILRVQSRRAGEQEEQGSRDNKAERAEWGTFVAD